LIAREKPIGLISIGEERNWEREPITQEKIDLIKTLATQISTFIHNTQLYQESHRQAEHLEVLNEVARAIGSTIELDDLLELIYEQLSKVIPSDTYFVSLYDPEENTLDVRILIDEGERFPSKSIPLGQGLSSWVIENQKPLLISSITKEMDSLPIQPIRLGKERMSESWLGTPILAGENSLGLLAIASYNVNVFDNDDVTLLNNVAAQAALALDNARQHAEVKEQARRDSLTGVYNHGELLLRLEKEVEKGRKEESPVSLIMLDIDFFKEYNDTYGHILGDEVLHLLATTIQSHVKKSDIVGRWGGEEFAIALPGADTEQATWVANRIRKSLLQIEMRNKHSADIPSPTVSQGIATFPQHADDAAQLIGIADIALYQAKGRGRDQVIIADNNITLGQTYQ
jgi:diguanylate cyclase (GGDEF)-like protein